MSGRAIVAAEREDKGLIVCRCYHLSQARHIRIRQMANILNKLWKARHIAVIYGSSGMMCDG